MDRKIFFDQIRNSLFDGRLKQVTVTNIGIILDYWQAHYPDNPTKQLAYILATVLAEVGQNMKPVREGFSRSDREARRKLRRKAYAKSVGPFGHAYYGRGYVQLTWLKNYQYQQEKLDIPLVEFPDLALETEHAIRILVRGMMDGDFNPRGKGLPYYLNEDKSDFIDARRTVNLLDRAEEIGGYAVKFLDALEAATAVNHPMHNLEEDPEPRPHLMSLEHVRHGPTPHRSGFWGWLLR